MVLSVTELLKRAHFPGQPEPYWLRTKRDRREILQSSEIDNPDRRVAAAIEIQRIFRGFRVRRKLYDSLQELIATLPREPSQVHVTRSLQQSSPTTRLLHGQLQSEYSERVSPITFCSEPHLSSYMAPLTSPDGDETEPLVIRKLCMMERLLHPQPDDTNLNFEEFCSRYIDHWWFEQRARRNRLYSMEADDSGSGLTRDKAASIIQRAWRRHIDVQVYHYYRDLIKFYSKGNPKLMLKCINPKEGDLLDFAAGIHIRFRLAGEKFPPNIYYKIFTYRPVTDINAFAPRDYTVPSCAIANATVRNNKLSNPQDKEDLSRWYQRQENNGWRLVSDRIFTASDTDTLIQESSAERRFFHYSRLRRQKDVEAKRKEKKRQWMATMYRQGKEQEADLTENEVEELVNWCDDLNFDSYVTNWLELATAVAMPASDYLKSLEQCGTEATYSV